MTFDEACEMDSLFQERLGRCDECGCLLKIRHEAYEIGNEIFHKNEVYCENCESNGY